MNITFECIKKLATHTFYECIENMSNMVQFANYYNPNSIQNCNVNLKNLANNPLSVNIISSIVMYTYHPN